MTRSRRSGKMPPVSERVEIRPMIPEDVDDAYLVNSLALADSPEERELVYSRGADETERRKELYRYVLAADPEGCFVAEDGGRVVGSALSARREGVWILVLFAVEEGYRGSGVGERMISRALDYGEECSGGMIASSRHPGAMRRYALAGFDLRPTLMASGAVNRERLPVVKDIRQENDLELAAQVDRSLRGAAHGPDMEFLTRNDGRLLVADRADGRGYAALWHGAPRLVAATSEAIAADLLRAGLAESTEERVEVRWITAGQDWAVRVALEAGLSLSPAGPICTRGKLGPLAPYLPSGPFL